MRKTPNRNTVIPGDAHLWRAVAESARPLKRRRGRPPSPRADLSEDREKEKIGAPATPPKTAPKPARQPPAPPLPALHPGAAPGVDRATAARLRKGEIAIDATLDLHGFTQAEAHTALIVFIARARAAGHRCVRVITGKGGRAGLTPRASNDAPLSGRADEGGRAPGVLRASVPRWLNEAPLRAHVLAFTPARPRHGGEGALYVLIRRVREAGAR